MVELKRGLAVTPNLHLERLLGEGAMGSVWVAHHAGLATDVAVKFIARDHRQKNREAVLTRFEREAKAAAQIKSPHVVHMYDHGVMEGGTPYIVMELLEGDSLGTRLRREGALPLEDVRQIVEQVAKALGKAHELGIVHRDIKPDNIFIVAGEDELFVKVVDFGIAKSTQDPQEAVTTTGAMLGTPLYMSPELVRSSREADPSADLWALAVVAYEALTGKPPFRGETVGALFFSICGDPVDPPSSVRAGLPRALDAWFSRALCQEPDKRYASARELSRAFARALDHAEGELATVAAVSDAPGDTLADAALATGEFLERHGMEGEVDTGPAAENERDGDEHEEHEEAEEDQGETLVDDAATLVARPEPPADVAAERTLDGAASTATTPRRSRGWWWAAAATAVVGGLGYYASVSDSASAPAAPAVSLEPSARAQTDSPFWVRCEPDCERVRIDGRVYLAADFRRLAEEHEQEPADDELRLRLPPGEHRLELERSGYQTASDDVQLEPGAVFEHTYTLARKIGRLDPNLAEGILGSAHDQLDACYAAASKRTPNLRLKLDVSLWVDPKGAVEDVTLGRGGDDDLRRCVTLAYQSLRFPAPEGDGFVELKQPIAFAPKAKPKAATPLSTRNVGNMTKKSYAPPSIEEQPVQQQQEQPPLQQQQSVGPTSAPLPQKTKKN